VRSASGRYLTKVAKMQCTLCVLLAIGVSLASGSGLHGSAVSKVVKMLKDLEAKLDKEQEKAQDLHDKFVCTSKSTVESKGKAIEEADARIAYLETYIADIGSGKVTFTMNEKELAKELKAVGSSLQNDTALREVAHAHFVSQQNETTDAVDGLATAINTLAAASNPVSLAAGSKAKGLVQLRGTVQSGARLGARARMQRARHLQKALELGDQYLSTANANFLHHMLTGQSNQAQRSSKVSGSSSASTAVSAQARLGDVVKTLQGIKDSFQKDLELSKRSDLKEFQAYMKRHQAQQEQQEALEASLGKLEKEYAARNQAKVESEEEISTLKDQIATDKTIKADTAAALEERKTEWDERLLCSQGELQALGQAIETLTSDDARDLFRKAKSFVQVSSDVTLASAARAAGQVLRSAGKAAKDHRLLILAAKLSGMRQAGANITNPTFDKVFSSMDDMVAAIKSEDQSDLTKKESCEEALANNTAEKKRLERDIENEESAMSSAQGKISEMSSRLKKIAAQQAEVTAQVKSADELRDAEAAAFTQSKKDDQNAIQLIEQATAFITKFYSDDAAPAGSSLLQITSSTCTAGAQSSGIVQTMQMVADDVKKEILEAEKDEKEALAAYEKNKAAFEAEKDEIDTARSQFQTVRSTKSLDLTSATGSKTTITGLLDGLVGTMTEVKPNCDFYIDNFESRYKNRQTELEGLKQAKVILQSA